ncbi:helix-turn-helix domain-containing protein [Chitinophaga oryziterrae]|uniref:Helix-turn-helix domain-containing protein n=1 Tax=Chitinophaga oryziterrae TaxID=1031224 RepID=A0A6N8J7B5_9BACT|nr:helix-turn-helix domain-containing protein [Chitinophaga oryziterrae]MVT40072.1 helix-turn-helix domain-containing protein [Chitinophaga oryziterrae]
MPINFFRHICTPDDAFITRISPPESLRDFVEGFYLFKTQDLHGRQLFFNDGYPVITLMQHRGSKILINLNGDIINIGNAWVCGGLLKNIYCESSINTEEFFVIRFNPITFFKLFNIRENVFEHKPVFDLVEIITDDFSVFNNDFYSNTSVEHKVEAATGFLSQRICATAFPDLLKDLINHIEQGRSLTVRELSKACGVRLNYKWLERNFKKYIGVSPKDYLLLRRFLNAYRSLDSLSSKTLLQTALEHGYYDDNHLIKDFRSFSGQSPKAFFQNISRT